MALAAAIDVVHGIQLAVAPVFLLTAVSSMIGAVASRLARIIDRARQVEDRAVNSQDPIVLNRVDVELKDLRMRGRLANSCIALLTLCSFLIGLTIIVLFLSETTRLQISAYALGSFLAGVGCFLLALVCFMVETFVATRVLDFHVRH